MRPHASNDTQETPFNFTVYFGAGNFTFITFGPAKVAGAGLTYGGFAEGRDGMGRETEGFGLGETGTVGRRVAGLGCTGLGVGVGLGVGLGVGATTGFMIGASGARYSIGRRLVGAESHPMNPTNKPAAKVTLCRGKSRTSSSAQTRGQNRFSPKKLNSRAYSC